VPEPAGEKLDMGKKFCKWCNEEARLCCKVCGSLYCGTHGDDYSIAYTLKHRKYGSLYVPEDFSLENLESFKNALAIRSHDQNTPIEKLGGHFYGTYRHFAERVYPEVNFEILRGPLCDYCKSNIEQRFTEKLFPVLQSVKESGLICAYYPCPLDAEEKCENCNKYFCKSHLVKCSRCGKTFCCSIKRGEYHFSPYGGCQSAHKHWRTWRWE